MSPRAPPIPLPSLARASRATAESSRADNIRPGSPTKVWRPTPNSGGDVYPTWPCTIALQDSTVGKAMIGEMDDVRWFPATIGPVVAEDTLLGDTHTVFQCGNRSEPWALFLMRTRP